MYTTNESEHEYRNGNSGPKYLMQGPRSNFGIMQLQAGETAAAHLHEKMEESFYVLEGAPTFSIADQVIEEHPGDFLNAAPGEPHKIENHSDSPCKFIINTAPFFEEGDKVLVDM